MSNLLAIIVCFRLLLALIYKQFGGSRLNSFERRSVDLRGLVGGGSEEGGGWGPLGTRASTQNREVHLRGRVGGRRVNSFEWQPLGTKYAV